MIGAKLNKIQPWQAAVLLSAVALAVFFSGLHNPFQGDDNYQIVSNLPVHSLRHLPLLFRSSTFFNGQALTGVYYRPLMSTVFALIYTFFGPHPWAFHLLQLAIYTAGAWLFYLLLRRWLKPVLALPLALIFLVHPLNSQVVYAIPSMQDALFFFFGLLGFWILANVKTPRGLWLAALSLFLCMLSKETGVVFVVLAILYMFWFDKKRWRQFATIICLPVVLYILMKINAVGLNRPQHGAPIDNLSLGSRLLTLPSLPWFYITKLLFPFKLASGYYWTYTRFSFGHVLLPGVGDLAVIGLFIYGGLRVKRKLPQAKFQAYLFFGVWAALGILPYLQLIKLDMTACEAWFYLSMAGLLGMIGLFLSSFKLKFQWEWPLLLAGLLVVVLGVRSGIRATDYRSQFLLAQRDMAVSVQDYSAMNNYAQGLIDRQQYKPAAVYARQSARIYPTVSNYNNLGIAQEYTGQYAAAQQAFNDALKYGSLDVVYQNLAQIGFVYNGTSSTTKFYQKALKVYPQDYKLWLYFAIFEARAGQHKSAQLAAHNATVYGNIPPALYNDIVQGVPFSINLPISKTPILVPGASE